MKVKVGRVFSPNHRIKDCLQTIYNLYEDIEGFRVSNLQKCLLDIGVIHDKNSQLIQDIVKKGLITNLSSIS
jgi:hypothetical protein